MSSDYGYINARIRAMKSRLFDRRLYNELLAKPNLDELLASLAQTGYREGIEAALARYGNWEALRDGLRRDLTASLCRIRSMVVDEPASEAARLLRILLARWDRRNLLTILRMQIQGPVAVAELDLLVPAGDLDETDLAELVRQPDLRAMIDLAATWQLPYASGLRRALPQMLETGNPAVLEVALDQQYATLLQENLGQLRLSESVRLVRKVLGWELDQLNLLSALRLRQAWLRGEIRDQDRQADSDGLGAWYLTGGAFSERFLRSLITMPEADQVHSALAEMPDAGPWRPAVEAWVAHGTLTMLQRALEERLTTMAIALFRHDPLTIAPVIGYIWAKENEVRNLRLIGIGMARGLPRAQIAAELYIPW